MTATLNEPNVSPPDRAAALLNKAKTAGPDAPAETVIADCSAALECALRALAEAYRLRAAAHVRRGSYARAVTDLTAFLRLAPDNVAAYVERARAHYKQGNHQAALADLTEALKREPGSAALLARRAEVLRALKRHDLALHDLTAAVLRDARYAAAYCGQRIVGQLERGESTQVLADLAVLEIIAPRDPNIPTWRQQALRGRPSGAQAAAAACAIDLHGPRSEAAPLPRASAEADEETDLAIQADDATEEEPAEVMVERLRAEELERLRRQREVAAKAAEMRRRNEEAEATRNAREKKRRAPRDPEEIAERNRKIKQFAIIAAGLLAASYLVVPFVWGLIPPSKNPFGEVAAEKLVADYAKDAAKADDKFHDKVIVVRGKVKVVREKAVRGRATPPAKVYLEVPDEKITLECQFDDADVANDLVEGTEYRISGRIQRYKPGAPITLRQATVVATPTA